MTHERSFLLYWLPLLLYIGLIFTLSSQSSVPQAQKFNDKFLHICEYGMLAFLLWRAFSHQAPESFSSGRFASVVAAGAACGALDELYQSTVPGRFSSIFDWFADVAGIIVMTTLLYLLYKYRRGKGLPI
jgi:VanZ family protein